VLREEFSEQALLKLEEARPAAAFNTWFSSRMSIENFSSRRRSGSKASSSSRLACPF
jgi:hypothetical protein